ncbi:MAG TPA: PQQ-binding-like beta-propeller repeat protein [Gemmatimonadaceae bacterium]|nr:PQQ-binding-like beta-propeller repeat protein [Gemmatimonadaceae bacterium]
MSEDPELVWRSADIRGTVGAPAVGERVTVVATVDRWVYALDTRTGQLFWRYRIRGTLGTGPLIAGGLVIVGTQGRDGQLAAIDLYTGKRRWNDRIGDIASPLAIHGNVVYGATQNGLVFAYSIEDGHRRWVTGGAPTRSGPLLVGRHLAVATLRDTLVVLEASTGLRVVRAPLPATAVAPLALLDDSTLVLSSPSGAVMAIEIPTGRVRWQVDTEAPVYGAPVVARDTVFALTNEGVLWAIPVNDPDGLVKASIGGVSVSAPVVLRHGVLVATVDGHVIYFDRVTGRRVWMRRAGGELRHPPIVAQGQIVVAPILGEVLSFR